MAVNAPNSNGTLAELSPLKIVISYAIIGIQITRYKIILMMCLAILFFTNLKTKILIAKANPVPKVPKNTSTIPSGLKILAIATPKVIGNQYFLLNTTNCESDSLIRNWIAPYENGAIANVNTT